MRNLKAFAVFDNKAEVYQAPFFMPDRAVALRSWKDIVNDDKTQFNKHPDDFELHELGGFNIDTGLLEQQQPSSLGLAREYITKH